MSSNQTLIRQTALGLALTLLSGAGTALEYKGPGGICNTGCTNIGINTQAKQAQTPPPATARLIGKQIPEQQLYVIVPGPQTPPKDVDVDFRYSAPDGNGRAFPLDNGSLLHDGDEFTISIQAHTDLYVYLFHFDSHGQLQELVSTAGHAGNRVRLGEYRELPKRKPNGGTRHFELDHNPGIETFHLIVSPQPQNDLMRDYRAQLLSKASFQRPETKGILIVDDRPSKTLRQGPRQLACPAKSDYCRETFTIHHPPCAGLAASGVKGDVSGSAG